LIYKDDIIKPMACFQAVPWRAPLSWYFYTVHLIYLASRIQWGKKQKALYKLRIEPKPNVLRTEPPLLPYDLHTYSNLLGYLPRKFDNRPLPDWRDVRTFVLATPISGPALMWTPQWVSRLMLLPTTLVIPTVSAPLFLQYFRDIRVSAVSPEGQTISLNWLELSHL